MNERHPLREPMVWLMAGIPLASVIAGIGLVIVAVTHSRSDQVIDHVQRTAQVQVADLSADQRAQQLHLSAVLQVNPDTLRVLPATGEFMRNAPLRVRLLHPTDGQQDRTLLLQPDALGWSVTQRIDTAHDWKLHVEPVDGSWRLLGRLPATQAAAHLGPALQAQ